MAAPATLPQRVPLFCRHNRRTADCPICSRGTVLDPARQEARRPRPSHPARAAGRRAGPAGGAPAVRGPFGSAGPYFDDERYEVRLERVPGGLRLAGWAAGAIRRRAPVIDAGDLGGMVREAAEREALRGRDAERMLAAADGTLGPAPGARVDGDREAGGFGASPGSAGDLRDELRVERLPDGRLRIARWTLRPNHDWELHEAPVLLPAARFAEALERAAVKGVLASA